MQKYDPNNRPIWAVPIEVENQRLDICKTCESFDTATEMCSECNCFMPMKVIMPGTITCPIGKW